jgi:hypothetical protein
MAVRTPDFAKQDKPCAADFSEKGQMVANRRGMHAIDESFGWGCWRRGRVRQIFSLSTASVGWMQMPPTPDFLQLRQIVLQRLMRAGDAHHLLVAALGILQGGQDALACTAAK